MNIHRMIELVEAILIETYEEEVMVPIKKSKKEDKKEDKKDEKTTDTKDTTKMDVEKKQSPTE